MSFLIHLFPICQALVKVNLLKIERARLVAIMTHIVKLYDWFLIIVMIKLN